MKNITIVCPAGKPTGGVELLHQFGKELVKAGCNVNIYYHPEGRVHGLEEFYGEYLNGIKVIKHLDGDSHLIVIPETMTYLVDKYDHNTYLLWWLSVDNYLGSKTIKFAIANKFIPYTFWKVKKQKNVIHAVQSQYARDFLKENGIDKSYDLSDYINSAYFSAEFQAKNLKPEDREDLILYNPSKGGKEQKNLVNFLSGFYKLVPLRGLSREEMTELLGKAKLYIDFGEHPGKDRIPREAASLGCCIVTNTKGSAKNSIDINIDPQYKFEQVGNYQEKVLEMIHAIMNDYSVHFDSFEEYRKKIRAEKELFEDQVKSILVRVF